MYERCTRKRNFSSLSPFFNHRLPKSVRLDLRKMIDSTAANAYNFINLFLKLALLRYLGVTVSASSEPIGFTLLLAPSFTTIDYPPSRECHHVSCHYTAIFYRPL